MYFMTEYEKRVINRDTVRYLCGLAVRWKSNLKYSIARRIARRNGARIGQGVVMPISLAKKLNGNCSIGNHVSIQTDDIDTRSPLSIGNNVIIGAGTKILTASHNIDSEEWEYKQYGLTIEDFVWISTDILIMPSCRCIGYGAVISSGSVVIKNVDAMSVVSGNPAREFRKRKCVHTKLVVESLCGGDFDTYRDTRRRFFNKTCQK